MRVIAHLSDLHFGREDARVAEALLQDLRQIGPSLVAISGDLTQRAREKEFRAVRAFLAQAPAPLIAVPGNHDIPLGNLFLRFFSPFRSYKKYICDDPDPTFIDSELALFGLNTAHPGRWKRGALPRERIEALEAPRRRPGPGLSNSSLPSPAPPSSGIRRSARGEIRAHPSAAGEGRRRSDPGGAPPPEVPSGDRRREFPDRPLNPVGSGRDRLHPQPRRTERLQSPHAEGGKNRGCAEGLERPAVRLSFRGDIPKVGGEVGLRGRPLYRFPAL